MAIQTSIITFKGKLDNIVGQKSFKGLMALRKKVTPKNPRTQKQTIHRAKIAIIGKFAGKIKGVVNHTFKNPNRTSYSEFINVNFENIIGGTWPTLSLLYDKVQISRGNLANGISPNAVIESNTVTVSWTDNSGIGDNKSSDQAILLAFNSVKQESVYTMDGGTRSSRQATLTLPSFWSGDSVDIWLAMTNGNDYSDSVYLGNFSI